MGGSDSDDDKKKKKRKHEESSSDSDSSDEKDKKSKKSKKEKKSKKVQLRPRDPPLFASFTPPLPAPHPSTRTRDPPPSETTPHTVSPPDAMPSHWPSGATGKGGHDSVFGEKVRFLPQDKKSKKSHKEPKQSGEVPQITEADYFAKNPEFRSAQHPPLPPPLSSQHPPSARSAPPQC